MELETSGEAAMPYILTKSRKIFLSQTTSFMTGRQIRSSQNGKIHALDSNSSFHDLSGIDH